MMQETVSISCPPQPEWIRMQGVRVHNLKDISLELPRDRLVVITGLSGSGKSSLAFNTLYAEGQRRYIESLSSYARQFLQQMPRPDCDRISGLPPTVAVQQEGAVSGPQSTVATTTEIYDYLRLLFARAATPHCPECGAVVEHQSLQRIVAALSSLPAGTRLTVVAPVVRGRKGHYRELLENVRRDGFVKVRIDGVLQDLDDVVPLDRYKTHDIDVVIDRMVMPDAPAHDEARPVSSRFSDRLADSVRTALGMADGVCGAITGDGHELTFNRRFACPRCQSGFEEPTPRMFSFNSPYGRCPACRGRGAVDEFDADLIVPDGERSLDAGAVEPFHVWKGTTGQRLRANLRDLAHRLQVAADRPWNRLEAGVRRALLYGEGLEEDERKTMAVVPALRRLRASSGSRRTHSTLDRYISPMECGDCHGARLRKAALAVTIGGKNIAEITRMPAGNAAEFLDHLVLEGLAATVAAPVLRELRARYGFLLQVGLHYLGCDRLMSTLSTGESQRVRLASQLGSTLTGVCYILDEPSIGLHQRDLLRLLEALQRLRDGDNSVLVVEHDIETIRCADWVLDLGPGAGRHGGRVVYNGPLQGMLRDESSLTGRYVSGALAIPVPKRRRRPTRGRRVRIIGAGEHNLKDVNVSFPLGLLICVTGVSGSGKSTLVNDILLRALMRRLHNSRAKPGRHRRMEGGELIDAVLSIDQAPIGRTPRSTPATYTKAFDHIRRVFAETKQSKIRGYDVGRFSFNSAAGRCQECGGMGEKQLEMSLLPDMKIRCEACHGRRYSEETLQITVRGHTIADVLEMTVDEALEFFRNHPPIRRRLRSMRDVGLGYLKLGQASNTLSGGEAQRIKLAAELGKKTAGNTLYVLDEPTTGLHFADIRQLLATLHGLVDRGHTVLIIEHNLDVIRNADHIIDLGPEGGERGGEVVATGTPEQVQACRGSHTAAALRAT